MSSAKEAILARVRESIAYNHTIPAFSAHFGNALKLDQAGELESKKVDSSSNLVENFIANHTNNKAIVVQATKATLTNAVQEIVQQEISQGAIAQGEKLLYNPDIELEVSKLQHITPIAYTQSVDTMRTELFHIPISLVQARCGVADLGILGLSSNENAPRLSSLITNICIYLLPKAAIVRNIFNGIEFIKDYERSRSGSTILPSNIIFVAGPSRTADIELQTVFGVHGPRKTYALLY
ncbi:LUD domain-containing protein [uncultured Helicobacter sp.]|uniref:LutC/YkgG family protein n=1 Tax=uncultured Helicobacter sp. TaxID=175537 RepID=UPI00262C728E|nr:LUD domain-containing protein [uncultured Helicobacter sp.]